MQLDAKIEAFWQAYLMGVYREPDRDRPLARVASERPLDHSFRVFFGDRQGKL